MIHIMIKPLACLLILITSLTGVIYFTTYHPGPIEDQNISCRGGTPLYDERRPLKVMSYNVQFFAGKEFVFYFDLPYNQGPDTRPTPKAITNSMAEIAELIAREDPDILLLQEVHDGAKATDYEDQLERLQGILGEHAFPCHSSAFYWQADFVPHEKILGSVGMKLSTLSRYQLNQAWRHQLALQPMDIISQQFYLKRAILQVSMPSEQGRQWQLLNTHFDAFAQGSDTMQKQVAYSQQLLENIDRRQQPWVIGGDFNLLPPNQYASLAADQRYLYQANSELNSLFERWPSIPSVKQTQGADRAFWYTHLPNDPEASVPDRTIDYLFHSTRLTASKPKIINQGKALTLSDHFPVLGEFTYRPKP